MNAAIQENAHQAGPGRQPIGRQRRQPATEEHHHGQRGDQDHVGVFGHEEDGEGHARVLDMETGHDLRLALGDVERCAVGLGHAGDEVNEEQWQQRPDVPLANTATLRQCNIAQVEGAGGHQHTDQCEAHGNFIGHHLRRRAHGTEKRVLRIRGPAGDDDAVHTHRGHGQDEQQPRVDVGQPQRAGERDYRPRHQRRGKGQHRREQEQVTAGVGRNNDFLEQQLDGIGQRLQPALGADAVGAEAHLHIADDLALGVGQVGHRQQQRDQQRHDLEQDHHAGLQPHRQNVPGAEQKLGHAGALRIEAGPCAPSATVSA